MFGPVERLIAGRYLRPKREEGFISVIALFSLMGITLGVGTLIVVLAVMSGFRAELLGRILGLNGHLTVQAGPAGIADFDAAAARLREADGVLSVTPLVIGQVMATANEVASGAIVHGIREADLRARPSLARNILQGSLDLAPNRLAIGSRMAFRMGLGIGDRLTLISPKGTATAFGTVPRMKAYEVGAIFEVGMYEYDNAFIFMPFEAAELYFQLEDRASELELMVELGMNPMRIRFITPASGRMGWSAAKRRGSRYPLFFMAARIWSSYSSLFGSTKSVRRRISALSSVESTSSVLK